MVEGKNSESFFVLFVILIAVETLLIEVDQAADFGCQELTSGGIKLRISGNKS